MRTLTVYVDVKSPYAYLALAPTRALCAAHGVAIDWLPYVLDIPSYLGSARLDPATGAVIESARTEAQWRKVKYAYMDVRRQANRAGLTIRGTQKIWDTRLVSIALLFAKRVAPPRVDAWLDAVFAPFWRRELDVEQCSVVEETLRGVGIDARGFAELAAGDGARELERVMEEAHARGVFGVPSFLLGGELFWGREHLPLIGERLAATR
ncbi:MAG: DsbA family protein [Deltaproteobacteria bacterium]|nr:DsbA family protein [Deltaproteobacteria bacterium]